MKRYSIYLVLLSAIGIIWGRCGLNAAHVYGNIPLNPELVVQLGHPQTILSVDISKCGRYMVSGSIFDPVVILWDIASGKEIRTFSSSFPTTSVKLSPDDKYLLSGHMMAGMTLWDVSSGQKIKSFGENLSIFSIAFSKDGNHIMSGSLDGKITLWDVNNGKAIRTFYENNNDFQDNIASVMSTWQKTMGEFRPVTTLCFSPDGKYTLSSQMNGITRLLDVSTGQVVREYQGDAKGDLGSAFLNEGKQIITFGFSGEIRVQETFSEKILGEFTDSSAIKGIFSTDFKWALTLDRDEVLKLFEIPSGKTLREIKKYSDRLIPLSFLPNNEAFIGSFLNGTMVLVDINSGEIVQEFKGYGIPVDFIDFDPLKEELNIKGTIDDSGQQIFDASEMFALNNSGSLLKLDLNKKGWFSNWDIKKGAQIGFSKKVPNSYETYQDTPDYFLSYKQDNAYNRVIINFYNSKLRMELNNMDYETFKIILGLDAILDDLTKLEKVRDLWKNGENLEALRLLYNILKSAKYNDQKIINGLEETFDGYFKLNSFYSVMSSGVQMIANQSSTTTTWSPDDLKFVYSDEKQIKVTNLESFFSKILELKSQSDSAVLTLLENPGLYETTLQGHTSEIVNLAFSPDSKILSSSDTSGNIKIWQLDTGKEIKSLSFADHAKINRTIFSSEGNQLLAALEDGTLEVVELSKNEPPVHFHAEISLIKNLTCFEVERERNRFWAGFSNGRVLLIDIPTGAQLCSLYPLMDKKWAVVDSAGRFDTYDLEEMDGIHWVMPDDPMRPLSLEIFMKDYFEPKLLPRILAGEKFPPIKSLAQLNRVQPEVKIMEIKADTNNPARVSVNVKVGKAKGEFGQGNKKTIMETGISDLMLFRDRQLVGYYPASSEEIKIDSKDGKKTITFDNIKIPRKRDLTEIEFSAYAFNVDRVKSKTDRKTFKIPGAFASVKGNAYIISVGVNAYENPDWDLHYAANDAGLICTTLVDTLQNSGEFKEIVAISLISDCKIENGQRVLTENRATKKNFKAVLDLLAGKKVDHEVLKMIPNAERIREANPEDLVFISFSSHGDTDKRGNFYFFPYDIGQNSDRYTPLKNFLNRCISSDELSLWLRDVDAGEMVMVVDACHSAATVEKEGFKPGPMGSRGLGQLAYNKGMKILAASQADKVAQESSQIRHGLLTYALVHDGIETGDADFEPKDKSITLSEWLKYGVERVPILCRKVLKSSDIRKYGFQQPALFDFTKKKNDIILLSF